MQLISKKRNKMQRVYYWVGLTVQQPFNTGVQRVTRCLAVALKKEGIDVIPVKWDDAAGKVVPISQPEADHLAKWGGPRITPPAALPENLSGEWLLIPEITPMLNAVGKGKAAGMRVAIIFYDMIPLKTPEFYDAGTFKWLDEYWITFAAADLALPISKTVRYDLVEWLLERRARIPLTQPCLLSGELPNIARITLRAQVPSSGRPFRLLATGSWEPRKNYPRIIRALETARKTTAQDIRLTIVGRSMDAEFPALQTEIRSLAAQLGIDTLELHDYMSDSDMNHLFDTAQATIFGSWVEGFGLPVLESLWRGLPCICHNGSALAEIAPGGGTLMVDMEDEDAIADGIVQLASNHILFEKLSAEALIRPLRTWSDYGKDVLAAIQHAHLRSILREYDPLGA
jgi:glycosyltransferase involved in cell wall biosynthesis